MRYSTHMHTAPTFFANPSAARARALAAAPPTSLALVALLTMLLTMLMSGAAYAHPSSFPDVGATSLGHEAIEYLSAIEVVGGYQDGTFRPSISLSRGQAAKMLVRQAGLTVASTVSTRTFKDIESVYGTYVEAAAAKGWITGYPDSTFRTYDPLQRQHMAVIVVRSMGWETEALKLSSSQVSQKLSGLTDAARITATARPYVALSLDRGLFKGEKDGRFNPGDPITRAQFSLVAYRAEMYGLARVEGLRASGDHPDKTRVVIDLSAAPGAIVKELSGSSVLVVDIAGAYVEGGGIDTAIGSPEIERVAARQLTNRPQEVRATLTLNRFSRYEVSVIPPSDGRGYRVVIDVFRRTGGSGTADPPLIAIDPGHGGKDPGARGVTGVLEKDVNLSIGLLVDRLLRDAGLRTLLTRDDDSYPTLQQRTDLANQAGADVFVSIHNNAGGDPLSEGTETFYWGTSAEDYSIEGKRLAQAIQRNLTASLESVDRGARTHWNSLHVLRESLMPAALTEVGFLTNAEEEAKLKDPVYLQAAALGIARGILEFFGWDVSLLPASPAVAGVATEPTTTTSQPPPPPPGS
ncbi:MAG: N-acetylmuramoyl-L-alanine amidase [Thermoleophilia bacterium]